MKLTRSYHSFSACLIRYRANTSTSKSIAVLSSPSGPSGSTKISERNDSHDNGNTDERRRTVRTSLSSPTGRLSPCEAVRKLGMRSKIEKTFLRLPGSGKETTKQFVSPAAPEGSIEIEELEEFDLNSSQVFTRSPSRKTPPIYHHQTTARKQVP